MARIAITGSGGTVGVVLSERLSSDHDIIPIDLPDIDVRDTDQLTRILRGADILIHLAAVLGRGEGQENWRSPNEDPANAQIFSAVMNTTVALSEGRTGVKQFIHASSIHVEDTLGFSRHHDSLLAAQAGHFATEPVSGYGRRKRAEEVAVGHLAPLFVNGAVSLRLGGVTAENLPRLTHKDPELLAHERKVWLEHGDLADLVTAVIERPNPRQYDVVNAVSANEGRFHDISNIFGWEPGANSRDYLKGDK